MAGILPIVGHIDRLEPFREEARKRGVPEENTARWITAVTLPCAMLHLADDAPQGAPAAGTIGGRPHLPADMPLPRLPFLASVDLAAIPWDATGLPLPADGTLLFFADTKDLSPVGGNSPHLLVYLPAGTPVTERTPPSPSDEHWPEPFPEAELRMTLDPSLPNRAECSEGHPYGDELGGAWWDASDSVATPGMLQIGGHPWVWSNDPRPSGDWVLLAELGVDDMLDNDLCLTQWVIRPEDLAAHRFDRARASFDMVGES
jgi:hypothetical protein